MKIKKNDAVARQLSRYQVTLKLDPEYDSDVVKILKEVDKKQTFIKDCIRVVDNLWKSGKIEIPSKGSC